jgi:hypothetical protein
MTMKKIYFISKSKHNTILYKLDNKKYLLLILLLPVLFIALNSQNFFSVNAQSSLNNVIEQSQSNTQSSMQSNSNSNNGNCNNNISVQSQTTVNGKTTTTNKNICGDNTSVSTSTNSNSGTTTTTSGNPTLKGIIASVEYAPSGSVIINSVFGNWSLTTQGDNSKGFKSSFIIQPINYNNLATSTSNPSNLNPQTKTFTNTTSYLLSNFIANSVAQQNSDITYVGKIDVVQNKHSSDLTRPDETNIFKGQDVSITLLDNRVLVINFDKQSNLFDVFKNTPLVGLISSNILK